MPKHIRNIPKIVTTITVIVFAVLLVFGTSMVQAEDKDADLMRAAEKGDLKKITRLLDEGTDINTKDNDGSTALMVASVQGDAEVP